MIGTDPHQAEQMRAQMDQSLEQIERETSAFMKRLVLRWAIRWAIAFAIIFVLTRMVDWLDWLWWIAVPIAVLSLAVPLLFRRFLMKRLARVRGQMGGMAGGGATIDGDWRETSGNARTDASGPRQGDEPAGVIIDQSDPADDANGGGRL